MHIDDQLISRLEKLTRLQLSAAEKVRLKGDLNAILEMVEQLQEVDIENVEPLAYVNNDVNRLREDVVRSQIAREKALKNAPDNNGEFFRVPKVIDL